MQTSTVQLVVKKLHAFHVPFQLRLLDNHAFNACCVFNIESSG